MLREICIALGAILLMLLVQTAHVNAQLGNSTRNFMNSNESLPGITPQ